MLLRVHGPDLALAFYRDALVLEIRNDVANEGFHLITVDTASRPGVPIVLTNYQHGTPTGGGSITALTAIGA